VNLPDTSIGGTPAAGALSNSKSTALTFSSPTGTTFACTLDGASIPCNANVGPLTEGSHTVTARAGISPFGDNVIYYDPSPASRSFTVDSQAPSATITSGPAQDSLTSDTGAAFTFTGSDPTPGSPLTFRCSLDGADFGTCPQSYAGLAVGPHAFLVVAVDAAGNVGAPAGRTWTVIGDADGDGFFTNQDCDDGNAAIHPGATDIPGNGVDEDCSGADAAAGSGGTGGGGQKPSGGQTGTTAELDPTPTVNARLARSFKVSRRGTLVRRLRLSRVTSRSHVRLTCKGKGCAFSGKTVKLVKGAVSLEPLFERRLLKPGAVITIRVSRQGMQTRVFTLVVTRTAQPKLTVRAF
jgi:hypothetical protein